MPTQEKTRKYVWLAWLLGWALPLTLLAVYSLNSGHQYGQEIRRLETNPAAVLRVDLSVPGSYTTSYHEYGFDAPHGKWLCVDIPGTPLDHYEHKRDVLEGLEGHFALRDRDGSVLEEGEFSSDVLLTFAHSNRMWLAQLPSLEPGEYELTLNVKKGAPDLAGKDHLLYARDELCGVEYAGMYFMYGIAAIAGLAAITPGAAAAWVHRRRKRAQ